MVDVCGYELPKKIANFHAKRLNQNKNIPKSFRGLLFDPPSLVTLNDWSTTRYTICLTCGQKPTDCHRIGYHVEPNRNKWYLAPRTHCTVLPPGKYNDMMPEPLPVTAESFMTLSCNVANKIDYNLQRVPQL